MSTLSPLLAETSAEVYQGFEDWFAQVVRRSKRHRQHLRQYRQTAAQYGLSRRLVVVMSLLTLAFDPTDRLARQPQPGSKHFQTEHQYSNGWIGHGDMPGVSN